MNTIPTHLVINAAINKRFGEKFSIVRSAFLWGSVAPDIPLFLLTIGYLIYLRFFSSQSIAVGMENAFNNLFFNDPVWIISHNFLHSPTMLLLLGLLFWHTRDQKRRAWWLSFLSGSMIHSIVNILTRHDDGPLLFFPFEWQTRFFSPISYWDSGYYASQVFWVEVGIDLVLLGYLFFPKLTFSNHTHDTKMRISDSHHLWFEIFPPEGRHVFSLPEKLQWSDWDLSDLWENTTIEVTDSYIYERDVSLSNNTHVTIVDTPSGFSMGWAIYKNEPGFVDCELIGLGEPGNEHGVYYEEMTWDLPCNNSSLTIKNSLLERAWPVTWGYINLKIWDSFLVDIRNYGGPATMEVYDSTVDIAAAYQGGRIYLENSPVREAIEVKDTYSFIYGFDISDGYNLLESDGGRFILLEEAGPPW